jgi:hypothetical protein
MKGSWSLWILVAVVACAIVASSRGQSADRPNGVDAERWVALSATAGIVLTDGAALAVADPRGRLIAPANRQVTGVLMVKTATGWTRVDLELHAARVQPLL